WKSQLQTEIALSSTESEYTGLSYALRDAIPMMQLLNELKEANFPIDPEAPKVHCKVFEDNSGALAIAKEFKYRPRTKHLNVKLHHFRDYVERKEISIHDIDTESQPADYLTKPLAETPHIRCRKRTQGW
ncbi:MAG: Ty1/Copia family ribonuclease HI, partial [Bacteroidota bacterium]